MRCDCSAWFAVEQTGGHYHRWSTVHDRQKSGPVALVQRRLEEENADPAMGLHCIIHQHALCSKCLKIEHVLSVILKTPPAFLEEIEATYGDVLYVSEVRWPSRGNVLKRFFVKN